MDFLNFYFCKEKALTELKNKFDVEAEKLDSQIKDYKNIVNEQDFQNKQIAEEYNRTKQTLECETEEKESWCEKYHHEKKQFEQDCRELRIQLNEYKKIQISKQQLQIKFNAERTAYET